MKKASKTKSSMLCRFFFLAGLIASGLGGCSYSIHNVHVSDFTPVNAGSPNGEGRVVKAQAEQFVVLGFVGQTDYVTEAYRKIQSSCKGGEIRGLTTQHSTAHGFCSWTNKVLIQGTCFGGAVASKVAPARKKA